MTAVDDDQLGVTYDPPYCYFEGNIFKFNYNGSNTGGCSTSDKCVCQIGSYVIYPGTFTYYTYLDEYTATGIILPSLLQ